VLWQNTGTVVERSDGSPGLQVWPQHWTPISGHASNKACQEALRPRFEEQPKTIQAGDPWTQYRCLPDTVDPRGPKGK
jgi:hypothetical protein